MLSPLFPDLIWKLEAIIRFCRERQAATFCDLTGQASGAIAQLVTKGPVISYFARWRRGTLEKVCQAVGCMYASFPAALNQLSFFVRMKDQTLVQLVRQLVANPTISHRLAFVT